MSAPERTPSLPPVAARPEPSTGGYRLGGLPGPDPGLDVARSQHAVHLGLHCGHRVFGSGRGLCAQGGAEPGVDLDGELASAWVMGVGQPQSAAVRSDADEGQEPSGRGLWARYDRWWLG